MRIKKWKDWKLRRSKLLAKDNDCDFKSGNLYFYILLEINKILKNMFDLICFVFPKNNTLEQNESWFRYFKFLFKDCSFLFTIY